MAKEEPPMKQIREQSVKADFRLTFIFSVCAVVVLMVLLYAFVHKGDIFSSLSDAPASMSWSTSDIPQNVDNY